MGPEADQAPGCRGEDHAEVDPHGADAVDGRGDEEVYGARVSKTFLNSCASLPLAVAGAWVYLRCLSG